MRPPNLRTTPLIQQLASSFVASEENLKFAGLPRGSVRGRVVDINDPELRGRVRVVFDDMNKEIPQVTGGGEYAKERVGEEPDASHWIDVSPPFKGIQPPGLLGKRVNISVSNGQYQYAVLHDVLHDPENLASQKLEMPNNSPMTRAPIYPSGKLPPAEASNHGCMVIEMDGPLQSDWMCVCLKRNGKYLWVRHVDLSHGHAGQNDSLQNPDSDRNSQFPVNNQTIWDYVFPTTAGPMNKQSNYGTDPRGNPYGNQSTWHGGAS